MYEGGEKKRFGGNVLEKWPNDLRATEVVQV